MPERETQAFPVETFDDARLLLRAPFTAAAVRWKVQQTFGPKESPSGGMVVGYIDARLVIERLNLIVGGRWDATYEPTASGLMWCHLTVCDITRSDVGEGQGKGLVSDSLKRAAVHFGVGVSLYAIPRIIVDVGEGDSNLKLTRSGKPRLTPELERHCAGLYEVWLDNHGRTAFGEPFDHGDVDGAQGDVETAAEPPPVAPGDFDARARAETPPHNPATGEVMPVERLREEARAALAAIGDDLIEQRLRGAGENAEALQGLLRYAEQKRAQQSAQSEREAAKAGAA